MSIEFHHGRNPNDPAKPRLRAGRYLVATSYPDVVDYLSKVKNWPMYLNDRYGCCTIAGGGHIIQGESTYGQGATQTITNTDVLTAYEAVSGFDPSTGKNDNGAVMQDVLSYWRKTGIGGHKILAFAELDVKNLDEVRQALDTFGSIYIGIDFPDSAMDQFNAGKPWDVVKGSPLDGGHAINGGYYDVNGNWKVVTWGEVQEMTPAFWDKYVEEAWIVVTPEWLNAQGQSPSGFDLHGLGEELAVLTGGANPFQPSPTPEPEPTPTPSDPDSTLAAFLNDWLAKHPLSSHPALRNALNEWLQSRS